MYIHPLNSGGLIGEFVIRSHLCGLDINLTYPQTGGNFPSVNLTTGLNSNTTSSNQDNDSEDGDQNAEKTSDDSTKSSKKSKRHISQRSFFSEVRARYAQNKPSTGSGTQKRSVEKRDLTGRANNSIDPWYGCFVWDEMVDYAVNYTYPWSTSDYSLSRRSTNQCCRLF